ncbi:hypothetical protein [Terricaulis silvestris]|uniref:Uncharacterized protein n=1 Tax=Terricaulis silvestris TaxID=2686094 RepID=A0A6I6MLA0_9CAUL|nr:hypothetical protein [Terricaulis silvestris]QGZ93956.1 hypothetical protein DSM104635_00771 [Terricaulis silvestris]
MKLARLSLAIALLACAVAAPAYAQQTQSTAGAQQDPRGRTDRRSAVGGRFQLDVSGHTAGFVDKVGGEEQTTAPPVQRVGPAAAAVVRPSTVLRPGTIILAPVTPAKDDDED